MHRYIKLVIILSLMLLVGNAQTLTAADDLLLYHVQPGDTLLDVSLYYRVAADELINLNVDVAEFRRVGSGQELGIPVVYEVPSELAIAPDPQETLSYVVQRGDTLFRIASRFNIPMDDIAQANRIYSPDNIFIGQELTIPGEGFEPPDDQLAESPPIDESLVPSPTITQGKQIVVVLSQQKAYAFEDGNLLRHFVVSTGLPATPTVQGNYAVYIKYTSQRMTGPGYDLPGVPWVMYFYQGYAFHGTYWHNNFGHPMSHGCVNMRTPEAAWLYDWAPIGTAVRVIWS